MSDSIVPEDPFILFARNLRNLITMSHKGNPTPQLIDFNPELNGERRIPKGPGFIIRRLHLIILTIKFEGLGDLAGGKCCSSHQGTLTTPLNIICISIPCPPVNQACRRRNTSLRGTASYKRSGLLSDHQPGLP